MILLIDNYDSFSYNLYQLVGTIDPDIKVIRNDELSVDEIISMNWLNDNVIGVIPQTDELNETGKKRVEKSADV